MSDDFFTSKESFSARQASSKSGLRFHDGILRKIRTFPAAALLPLWAIALDGPLRPTIIIAATDVAHCVHLRKGRRRGKAMSLTNAVIRRAVAINMETGFMGVKFSGEFRTNLGPA